MRRGGEEAVRVFRKRTVSSVFWMSGILSRREVMRRVVESCMKVYFLQFWLDWLRSGNGVGLGVRAEGEGRLGVLERGGGFACRVSGWGGEWEKGERTRSFLGRISSSSRFRRGRRRSLRPCRQRARTGCRAGWWAHLCCWRC